MIKGLNKYKFLVATDGVNYQPVILAKPVTVSGKKSEKCGDYRRESSEWKFTYSENPSIYNRILTILITPSTASQYIMAKIEYYSDFETLDGNEFLGMVPLSTIKVNEDDGTIIFTPKEFNKYLWYDEHKSDDKDVVTEDLIALGARELFINDTSVPIDFYIPGRSDCNYPPTNCAYIFNGDQEVPAWSSGTSYYGPTPYENEWQLKFWVKHNGKRYYCYKDHMGISGSGPGSNEPGIGFSWQDYWRDFSYSPNTNQVWHVRQQRSTFQLTGPMGPFVKGNDVFQGNFTSEIPGVPTGTNCPSTHYCYGWENVISGDCLISGYGNIKLFDLFDYLLTGSGLTFASQFFSAETNPVTGQANKFANTYISHKAFIKSTTDESTKGMISLEDLINDLCEYINGMWHIDEANNHLVIEHVNYYKGGKNYNGTPSYYADFTNKLEFPVKYQIIEDLKGKSTDRVYDYDNKGPKKEIFKPKETSDANSEINYTSLFADVTERVEHAPNVLSTDLLYVIQYQDDTSDDDFLVIAADSNDVVNRRTFKKGMSSNIYENHPNGDLFFDNLIRDFWIYARHFKRGIINADATETVFTSQINTKKQREITFPRLIDGLFDPQKLFYTNLGDGECESFEINTDTDYIKVSLMYGMDLI